jgi:adenylate cyclase
MTATRRLAAILAADVAGYSRLIGVDEEGTLNRLRSIRAEVIDSKISEHRGRIVKTTGDGLLVEFVSVVDALRCATEWQRGMAERNAAAPDDRIEFRIGINVGDVVVEDGDIFGDGVNVAARLESLANPGGICVSARVQEDAAGRLDLSFEDMGEQSLKNIARPVRAYRIRLAAMQNRPIAEPIVGAPILALPDKPSIAVLPFQNMSGDPEQEYFADGMVEEITTALSKVRWFFVISRHSSFTYKGRNIDVKQVGRELGVRYVLEGSVRRASNRIRIAAQLVETITGNHVWAERYDREITDIFAVQDEITAQVVATIEPELFAAEHFRSRRKPPEHLDAWECVIRAFSCVGEVTAAAITEAEALCRRAIAIAPDYSQAHSLLAWVLVRRTTWSGVISEVLPQALAEARTALGLDERDAWAHMAHGLALWRSGLHAEAERTFRRSLELNPNFALGYAYLGAALVDQGVDEDAISNAEYALRLNPSDGAVALRAWHVIIHAHFTAGRYADARVWALKTIERYPEHLWAYICLIAITATQGDNKTAAEALTKALRIRPDLSLAWVRASKAFVEETAERFFESLRKAGMPEK